MHVEPSPVLPSLLPLPACRFAKKAGGGMDSMKTVCGTPGYIAPEVIRGIMQPSGEPVDSE